MNGRSYTLGGAKEHRYGFNGKEKDTDGEWGSNTHYDYGFRIYNPAIGKFLSVDPLTSTFPYYTPYQFAGNKPIIAIDLDGLEETIMVWSRTVGQDIRNYVDKNGIEAGIQRLYNHDYYNKYPNGVMDKEWFDKEDHNWIDKERGTNLNIPNIVAEHNLDTPFLNEGDIMLITTKDIETTNNTIELIYQLYKCGDKAGEIPITVTVTQDGGYVIFGPDAGNGDAVTLPFSGDGDFDIIDMPFLPSSFSNKFASSLSAILDMMTLKEQLSDDSAPSQGGNSVSDTPDVEYDTINLGFQRNLTDEEYNSLENVGDTATFFGTIKLRIEADTVKGGKSSRDTIIPGKQTFIRTSPNKTEHY